jgi:hypothetical protein
MHMRIVVVGERGVGKTRLVRRFLWKQAPYVEYTPTEEAHSANVFYTEHSVIDTPGEMCDATAEALRTADTVLMVGGDEAVEHRWSKYVWRHTCAPKWYLSADQLDIPIDDLMHSFEHDRPPWYARAMWWCAWKLRCCR